MPLMTGSVLRVAKVGTVSYLGPGRCGYGLVGCRAPILWASTERGKRIALNPTPNAHGYYIAHAATCPSRDGFARGRR